jgi:dihydrofolate reductase|tara:strand:- start:682 stop:1269 length:588 start_codon:yes stop_codon:yes gene_type:complete
MNIIVATCKNRGIGLNGIIPWRLSEDMMFFKNKTIGNGNNSVIMGRKTYDSMERNLPKRTNYVISSTKSPNNIRLHTELYSELTEVNYDIMTKCEYDVNWVIGGEQIYNWYLKNNLIQDVYITNILNHYTCDTFFPQLPVNFKKIHSGNVVMSKENKLRFNIDVYRNSFYSSKNYNTIRYDFLKELDKVTTYGVI